MITSIAVPEYKPDQLGEAKINNRIKIKIQIKNKTNIYERRYFFCVTELHITYICRCMERSSSDGVSVEVPSQYCDPAEKPLEKDACHLFCSNECVVSEWSSWTSCKHTVKEGYQLYKLVYIKGNNRLVFL